MNVDGKLVHEIWDTFKVYVPVNKRNDIAYCLLKLFDDYGIEFDKDSIIGLNKNLDNAYADLFEDSVEVEPDEYEDDE